MKNKRSRFGIGELWAVSQYNSNNAWFYNYDNGKLNDNNKYYTLSARALDCNFEDYSSLSDFENLACEFLDAYYKCRKSKRSSTSQLMFEYNMSNRFIDLVIDVYNFEYRINESIGFMIYIPKQREVIAADFSDRIVQTWYVEKLNPYLESDWLDPDSYSCRKGKGGLRAVQKFRDYIFEITDGYTKDAWIVKRDISAFFMSIDTEVLEKLLVDFIYQHFGMEPKLREMMCWLTRIIYQSLPQAHCRLRSNPLEWMGFNSRKSMLGKESYIGLPIGNVTSQIAANFITTFYLQLLRDMGYKFVHYTDDTAIIITDKAQWAIDEKIVESYISEFLHLEWHSYKKYYQHYSKGVNLLGYKIRYGRILPSDRVAHNVNWKISVILKIMDNNPRIAIAKKEQYMSTVNSYMGLLKWCSSHKMRKGIMQSFLESDWKNIYWICDYKITILPHKKREAYFLKLNKQRKLAS